MEKLPVPVNVSEREEGMGRIEAFSDGVFAIAITLLVLDLKVPELDPVSPATLAKALWAIWPNYMTLIISFITILIMWVYHHRLFQALRKAETALLFANGLLLLLVTIVPFPTALVGAYLITPAASIVCAVYAGFFVLINAAFNLLLWVVYRQQAAYRAPGSKFSRSWKISLIGLPCYMLAAVIAFWNPYVSLGICCALWVAWAITAPRRRTV